MPRPKKTEVEEVVSTDTVAAIPSGKVAIVAPDYSWAVNPVKLNQAIASLAAKKKIDPSTPDDAEAVKAEYVKHAGALR